jgi:hypothetical protein
VALVATEVPVRLIDGPWAVAVPRDRRRVSSDSGLEEGSLSRGHDHERATRPSGGPWVWCGGEPTRPSCVPVEVAHRFLMTRYPRLGRVQFPATGRTLQ